MLDDETDFTVGIVSRNLATTSNSVKFRDSRNFTFFEALRVVQDTWRICVAQDETRVKWRASKKNSSSGTQKIHVATHDWREIQGRWIR